MATDKTENIRIRCTPRTKRLWAAFATTFPDSEKALEELLDRHGDLEELLRDEEGVGEGRPF